MNLLLQSFMFSCAACNMRNMQLELSLCLRKAGLCQNAGSTFLTMNSSAWARSFLQARSLSQLSPHSSASAAHATVLSSSLKTPMLSVSAFCDKQVSHSRSMVCMLNLCAKCMMGRASSTDFQRPLLGVSSASVVVLLYNNLRLLQMSATVCPGIGKRSVSSDLLVAERNRSEKIGDPTANRVLCTGTSCPSAAKCASARSENWEAR